ncbi:MAG: hypothetical protein HYY18_02080 [Planctomycetes bacterium]|nr:hypothetical protein [Planctomycetota bacterium]
MNRLAAVSLAISVVLSGAAGYALWELKAIERKMTALEAPVDPKTIPENARPAEDDPRGVLASRIEALERRVDGSDRDFAFNIAQFRKDVETSNDEIDVQAAEIMAKLADIRANPPQDLTESILEERVRAGLLEKRKKDMKKLVKKEGTKNLKKAQEKLNLTEAQMKELKEFFEGLYEEWSGTLARIFSGEEIPNQELDAKVEDTKTRVDTEMKTVLTPEQYTTWKTDLEKEMFRDPFQGGGR